LGIRLDPIDLEAPTTAASAAFSRGTIRVCRPRRLASKAIERTPLTGRNRPDNAGSPVMQNASRAGNRLFSSSFSIPRAIGRSKLGPSFRTSAGARLMVIHFPYGQRKPLLQMAEVTRSLLSLTAVSGSPPTAILIAVTSCGVDLDFYLECFDTDNGRRINLR
jgi:hypothetical protein